MRTRSILATGIGILALGACSNATDIADSGSVANTPSVLNVAPPNAATRVDPARPIVITFNRAMMAGAEPLVILHEGSVAGPSVAGVASWSADRSVLTFTPAAPLKPASTYVLHLSPSLRGANGQPLDRASCVRLGGRTVTPGMLGLGPQGGMMNGSWGPGMMGAGWRAADGTFGMIFVFTTA